MSSESEVFHSNDQSEVTSLLKHTLLGVWPSRGDLAVLRSCHVYSNTNHVVASLWRVFVSRWSDRVQNGSQVQSIRATTASELLGDRWSQRRVPPSGPKSFHICSIMDSEQALCGNEMFLLLTLQLLDIQRNVFLYKLISKNLFCEYKIWITRQNGTVTTFLGCLGSYSTLKDVFWPLWSSSIMNKTS